MFVFVIHWIVSLFSGTFHCLSTTSEPDSSPTRTKSNIILVFGIVMNVVGALRSSWSEHYALNTCISRYLCIGSTCVRVFVSVRVTWYKCPFASKKIFTMRVLCQFKWQQWDENCKLRIIIIIIKCTPSEMDRFDTSRPLWESIKHACEK